MTMMTRVKGSWQASELVESRGEGHLVSRGSARRDAHTEVLQKEAGGRTEQNGMPRHSSNAVVGTLFSHEARRSQGDALKMLRQVRLAQIRT